MHWGQWLQPTKVHVECDTKSAAHFLLFDHLIGAPGPLKSMKTTVPTGVENSYFS